eukprot:4347380-Alexandrium_andersonii.AAC.1
MELLELQPLGRQQALEQGHIQLERWASRLILARWAQRPDSRQQCAPRPQERRGAPRPGRAEPRWQRAEEGVVEEEVVGA